MSMYLKHNKTKNTTKNYYKVRNATHTKHKSLSPLFLQPFEATFWSNLTNLTNLTNQDDDESSFSSLTTMLEANALLLFSDCSLTASVRYALMLHLNVLLLLSWSVIMFVRWRIQKHHYIISLLSCKKAKQKQNKKLIILSISIINLFFRLSIFFLSPFSLFSFSQISISICCCCCCCSMTQHTWLPTVVNPLISYFLFLSYLTF